MTNPVLSVAAPKQIGRLYQLPSSHQNYEAKISTKVALEGLANQTLFPSITNCINVLNLSLEGYVAFMYGKALNAGLTQAEASKAHDTYREAAADRGTRVHLAIEDYIDAGFADPNRFEELYESELWKGAESYLELVKYDKTYNLLNRSNDLTYFQAFINFCREYKPEFIAQEATVYGSTPNGLKYAGTTDFIAKINGKTIIGDWKTTSKIHQTVALQLAAVANATHMTTDMENLEDMIDSDGVWAVQLKKDGTFEVYEGKDNQRAWISFCAARYSWDTFALDGKSAITGIPLLEKIS